MTKRKIVELSESLRSRAPNPDKRNYRWLSPQGKITSFQNAFFSLRKKHSDIALRFIGAFPIIPRTHEGQTLCISNHSLAGGTSHKYPHL